MPEIYKPRVILVTGSTDGIGKALAHQLAKQGVTVLIHGRCPRKCDEVTSSIRSQGGEARSYVADFGNLLEVQKMAQLLIRNEDCIDVLVNNAGLGIEAKRESSIDGNEAIFQVNCLAPYLLTELLARHLQKSRPARIINVASDGQYPIDFTDLMFEKKWHPALAYAKSKLALVMCTFILARKYKDSGITVNAIHPGSLMPTKLILGKFESIDSIETGVENIIRLIFDPSLSETSGEYFSKETVGKANAQAYDEKSQSLISTAITSLLTSHLSEASN